MSESQEHPPTQKLIGAFLPKMVSLTDDVLFSDIWERRDLSKRDRSLINEQEPCAYTRFGWMGYGQDFTAHPHQ